MDPMTTPTLEISRGRFLQNIAQVQQKIAPSTLMLVMKDDAYGHGIEWAVDAATELAVDPVGLFGGYDVPTSLRIRARTPDARVFAWATSHDEDVARALQAGVELGVGTLEYLRRVIATATAQQRAARVHLKVDTGLHRNGIRPEDWDVVVAEALSAERDGVLQLVGVWSHLAEASDSEDDEAAAAFDGAVAAVSRAGGSPTDLHLTASAASWWRPELRRSVSRIGAFVYGVRSADGPELAGLVPISTLRAPVLAVDGGEVLIGLGALHGFPSSLAGAPVGTPAGARDLVRVESVTSVVTAWPEASVGDEVIVFGDGQRGELDATGLAERIGTVGEEILTRLTGHVERVVID